jgi:hypothetical protein
VRASALLSASSHFHNTTATLFLGLPSPRPFPERKTRGAAIRYNSRGPAEPPAGLVAGPVGRVEFTAVGMHGVLTVPEARGATTPRRVPV